MAVTAPEGQMPLPVLEPIEWLRRREDEIAHAFATTGSFTTWFHSKCRRIRYTAGVVEDAKAGHCAECSRLVEGLTESEARLMDGDR